MRLPIEQEIIFKREGTKKYILEHSKFWSFWKAMESQPRDLKWEPVISVENWQCGTLDTSRKETLIMTNGAETQR